MSKPVDIVPIHLAVSDELDGRRQMRQMLGASWAKQRGGAAWAGFALERALVRAWATTSTGLELRKSKVRHHDLELWRDPGEVAATIEVKTRAVESGWGDPARFDYVVVPTHDGRDPIKEVDLVWFCWYSANADGRIPGLHRKAWVLGFVRGPEEFLRRSQYYREGEPLPRGGWAGPGGAYAIEVKQLRPFPRRAFRTRG